MFSIFYLHTVIARTKLLSIRFNLMILNLPLITDPGSDCLWNADEAAELGRDDAPTAAASLDMACVAESSDAVADVVEEAAALTPGTPATAATAAAFNMAANWPA